MCTLSLIFKIAKCEFFWRKRSSKSMSTVIHGFSGLGPDISLILVGFWENAEKAKQENHCENVCLF
jgi:hypothetical protein